MTEEKQPEIALQQAVNKIPRCPICDWPLADRLQNGCVLGNCSYRPAEGSAEWRRIRARRKMAEEALR